MSVPTFNSSLPFFLGEVQRNVVNRYRLIFPKPEPRTQGGGSIHPASSSVLEEYVVRLSCVKISSQGQFKVKQKLSEAWMALFIQWKCLWICDMHQTSLFLTTQLSPSIELVRTPHWPYLSSVLHPKHGVPAPWRWCIWSTPCHHRPWATDPAQRSMTGAHSNHGPAGAPHPSPPRSCCLHTPRGAGCRGRAGWTRVNICNW